MTALRARLQSVLAGGLALESAEAPVLELTTTEDALATPDYLPRGVGDDLAAFAPSLPGVDDAAAAEDAARFARDLMPVRGPADDVAGVDGRARHSDDGLFGPSPLDWLEGDSDAER